MRKIPTTPVVAAASSGSRSVGRSPAKARTTPVPMRTNIITTKK
jgi:hypothetical protein